PPGQYGPPPGQYGPPPGQYGPPPGQYGPPPGQYGAPPGQYGPPPGYGQQPPQQYGAQQQGYGAPHQAYTPQSSRVPRDLLADWGTRVLSFLVDAAPIFILVIVVNVVGAIIGDLGLLLVLSLVLWVASLGWVLYNNGYQQGNTGQSLGKRVMKIKLVAVATGQPIGFGASFVRQLAHFLEFGIGYLWPLWDDQKQTFADKIMSTVVIKV
ncbi:MAG: RDD family protein, partial [Pseudonocardia sp.]